MIEGFYSLLAQTTQATTAPSAEPGIVTRYGLDRIVYETPKLSWFALLGMIFLGVIVGRVMSELLRKAADRLERHHGKILALAMRSAASPVALLAIVVGTSVGLQGVMPFTSPAVQDIVRRVVNFLTLVTIGWFIYNLITIIDHFITAFTAKTESKLDDQLAPMIRKTLRIFVCVIFALVIAQNVFNQNVTAWLAGLGIAGLAVSLAAQDSIKNLFGSVTILLDKPFAVGDRIVFDGFEGPVEEIGFRSTKIRTLAGELVTIPNSKFIDGSVKNVTKRGDLQKVIDFTMRFDSSADELRQAMEIMRRVATEPGIVEHWHMDKTPPRVFFEGMKAESYNLRLQIWFPETSNWWGFVDIIERLQLRVLEEFAKARLDLAIPTQLGVPYESQCDPRPEWANGPRSGKTSAPVNEITHESKPLGVAE